MEDRELLKLTTGKLIPDDFSDSDHKEIFQLIKVSKKVSPANLMDKAESERAKELIVQIASRDLGLAELAVQLTDHLASLAKLKMNTRMMTLKQDIQRALQNGDTQTADRFTKEFEKLKKSESKTNTGNSHGL